MSSPVTSVMIPTNSTVLIPGTQSSVFNECSKTMQVQAVFKGALCDLTMTLEGEGKGAQGSVDVNAVLYLKCARVEYDDVAFTYILKKQFSNATEKNMRPLKDQQRNACKSGLSFQVVDITAEMSKKTAGE